MQPLRPRPRRCLVAKEAFLPRTVRFTKWVYTVGWAIFLISQSGAPHSHSRRHALYVKDVGLSGQQRCSVRQICLWLDKSRCQSGSCCSWFSEQGILWVLRAEDFGTCSLGSRTFSSVLGLTITSWGAMIVSTVFASWQGRQFECMLKHGKKTALPSKGRPGCIKRT